MSKADKMFEKLGYKKVEIDVFIQYNNINNLISINFNVQDKTVSKTEGYCYSALITMQELQAINEKVKELGWSEEK